MKPIKPKTRIPKAETLEINLNSSDEGFFRILQTLLDCVIKDFNFFSTTLTSILVPQIICLYSSDSFYYKCK